MRLRLLLAVPLLACAGTSAARDIEHRVALKRGHTAATLRGRILTSSDTVLYAFSAHNGQQVSIRLEPSKDLVAQALLVFPSGKQEGPGAELKGVTLDESGTFRIRVSPREQTSGAFRLYFNLL